MPVNFVESHPTINLPAETAESKHTQLINQINQTAAAAAGVETPQPIHQEGQKIYIEVQDPALPATSPAVIATEEKGLFHKLATDWDRFSNWRNTFFKNRAGTTKSNEGLEVAMNRAMDKAEEQGQLVTNVQK
jgi:hypothetical protein